MNILKIIKQIWKKKDQSKILHFIYFLILFVVIFFILRFITKDINLSEYYAKTTNFILEKQGYNSQIVSQEKTYSILINDMKINILDVCTGLFELILFLALIFSNLIVSLKSKLYGSLIFILIFILFNLSRILIMIYLLLNVNIYVVDIIHTILFKVGFFLLFIVYYYFWLILSSKSSQIQKM